MQKCGEGNDRILHKIKFPVVPLRALCMVTIPYTEATQGSTENKERSFYLLLRSIR